MLDNNTLLESFEFISTSIDKIQKRFEQIKQPSDFTSTENGETLLDAISMRLQAIGETLKEIEKSNQSFLEKYPATQWDQVIRFRDFISHHYEELDYEIIFDICKQHLPKISKSVNQIIADLKRNS